MTHKRALRGSWTKDGKIRFIQLRNACLLARQRDDAKKLEADTLEKLRKEEGIVAADTFDEEKRRKRRKKAKEPDADASDEEELDILGSEE